jgi:hypothetical protein
MAVITALGGNAPAQAAKAATTQLPIVFVSGGDPVSGGLVASFNRPGGNVTGVVWNATVLVPKRLELLRGLAGNPGVIGALVNPGYPDHDLQLRELKEAAATIRQEIIIAHAATAHDIDTAFASLVQKGAGALIVANDPFFFGLRDQIVALAARHALRQCTLCVISRWPAASSAIAQASQMPLGKAASIQARSSKAPNRPICRFGSQASSSWSSTSRLPESFASTFRQLCSLLLTR